jgi:hypothetical protein
MALILLAPGDTVTDDVTANQATLTMSIIYRLVT